MKAKILLMAVVTAIVMCFTSCDKAANSPLIGSWVYRHGLYTETVTFSANGNYKCVGNGGGISISYKGSFVYDEYTNELTLSIKLEDGSTTTAYMLCEVYSDCIVITANGQSTTYMRK